MVRPIPRNAPSIEAYGSILLLLECRPRETFSIYTWLSSIGRWLIEALLDKIRREEDKKRPSVLLVSQPVASKDCPLSPPVYALLAQG
ncbi:hypothetical protein QVD17_16861 [Tagetes erecta]|uniref:Uncharacterized protein n=1 Tax=Tagetes erecta TaxID=13708 RepID=A0AAD8KST0_TARER|nr:hypothetical protein QVD17_16861 [Tagetes erecta]